MGKERRREGWTREKGGEDGRKGVREGRRGNWREVKKAGIDKGGEVGGGGMEGSKEGVGGTEGEQAAKLL